MKQYRILGAPQLRSVFISEIFIQKSRPVKLKGK
jgi:hypothetical protein